MGKVIANMSMSLDGFIAGPQGEVDRVFRWYFSGEPSITISTGDHDFMMNKEGAAVVEAAQQVAGVLVTGRHTFDVANAWGGRHPMNVPVVVLTHRVPQEWANKPGSPFTFVTDGIESAIEKAQKLAGDKIVAVGTASTAQQCLKAGLLDEIRVDLAPVLLGEGIPFFRGVEADLEVAEVQSTRNVTHITYRVIK